MKSLTPLTILVPTLVTNPFTLSERNDERTSVEPGSFGASKATHSSSPSFKETNESCRDSSSHWSSLAWDEVSRAEVGGLKVVSYQRLFLFGFELIGGNGWIDPGGHTGRATLFLATKYEEDGKRKAFSGFQVYHKKFHD